MSIFGHNKDILYRSTIFTFSPLSCVHFRGKLTKFNKFRNHTGILKSENYTRSTRRNNFAVIAEINGLLVPAIVKCFVQVCFYDNTPVSVPRKNLDRNPNGDRKSTEIPMGIENLLLLGQNFHWRWCNFFHLISDGDKIIG